MVESCKACAGSCECRKYLERAALGLRRSSEMLSDSISAGSDEVIEVYFARLRLAQARLTGALAAHKDHLVECGNDGFARIAS